MLHAELAACLAACSPADEFGLFAFLAALFGRALSGGREMRPDGAISPSLSLPIKSRARGVSVFCCLPPRLSLQVLPSLACGLFMEETLLAALRLDVGERACHFLARAHTATEPANK